MKTFRSIGLILALLPALIFATPPTPSGRAAIAVDASGNPRFLQVNGAGALLLASGFGFGSMPTPSGRFGPAVDAAGNYQFLQVDSTGALITSGGLPAGGTTSQVLAKASNADNDVHWTTVTGSGVEADPIASAINGILKSNGTTLAAATISAPLAYSSGTLSLPAASGSQNGYLSSTDWTSFNAKLGTVTADTPLSGSGTSGSHLTIANAAADGSTKGAAAFTAADFDASSGVISIDYTNGQKATGSVPGFLTAADWTTFNGKITNPMTTAGDLILGGSSGTPGRLAVGSDSYVLTVSPSTHLPVWSASASGFANPMTTAGDIILGGSSGTAGRLAVGTDNYVLTVSPSTHLPVWAAAAATTTFANPSGSIGMTASNGSAGTAMRSDATPALSAAIAPHWTAQHIYDLAPEISTNNLNTGTALTVGKVYYDSLSANRTLTFSGTPAEGDSIVLNLVVTNAPTLTIPSCIRASQANSAITSLVMTNGRHILKWTYVNSTWVLTDTVGVSIANLASGTMAAADLLPFSQSGTDKQMAAGVVATLAGLANAAGSLTNDGSGGLSWVGKANLTANTFSGAQTFGAGVLASGAVSNDFSGGSGTFKTSTGANTLSGAVTVADATTPSITTSSGKTNTGFLQINGKTSGALKLIPVDAAAQTVTISLNAQTSGAATITIPDMAGVGDTFSFLGKTETITGNKTFSGTCTFPTQTQGNNSTDAATTAYVDTGLGTKVTSGGALGTPSGGTLTNCTGLPVSGITASTSTALGVGSIELGHASDTTIARVSAGVISVEGVTVDTISAANTLTNKRVTARVGSTTSSATPTINTDNYDVYKLTAQAADITSMTTNLSGTPSDGDQLEIRITGTAARAITWGTGFVAGPVALPTTTVTTKTLRCYFEYDSVVTHWVLLYSGSDS